MIKNQNKKRKHKDTRDIFVLTLDSIMEKLHIADDTDGNKTRNIFDELSAKIKNNMEK